MSKEFIPKHRGTVTEVLPNAEFRVESDMSYPGDKRPAPLSTQVVRCYSAGKLRQNRIFIAISDRVEFEYPLGSAVGRIIRRLP